MSVSDPLLKKLKDQSEKQDGHHDSSGYIIELRTESKPIKDDHPSLQPFCETLELILQKGLKQSTSVLSFKRKDYWDWIEAISQDNAAQSRVNPVCRMCVQAVKSSKKSINSQGRGRHFIRLALQKKVFSVPIVQMIKEPSLCMAWYDSTMSILGDEILAEILMSQLFEVTEINFRMNTKNCSFLAETWELPLYKEYEFVPCKDLGIQAYHYNGRVMAASLDQGGVAEEDGKVEPGDIVDELLGESLFNAGKGKIPRLLKQNQGCPVYVSIIKCKKADGSVFPPIAELLKRGCPRHESLQIVLEEEEKRRKNEKMPPHAILPEDEEDEIPVHSATDRAKYKVQYVTHTHIGTDGGVHKIEGVIDCVLKEFNPEKNKEVLTDVYLELGEKDVIVNKEVDEEELYRHSYTGISSCGRRTDHMQYFSYIAGETTCTLAQDFIAYVFKAKNEEESRTILMAIAQGFGRTHWLM